MSVINKKIVDFAIDLDNKLHETYCREYVRLDLEDHVVNKKARRVKAYRFSFPETYNDPDGTINSRACTLLRGKNVSSRIKYLYEQDGSSVENEFNWTRSKSEDVLLSMIYNEESKDADRLKAVNQLNTMRGIDSVIVKKEDGEIDTVSKFFRNLGIGGNSEEKTK